MQDDISKLREKALLVFDGREEAWTEARAILRTMKFGFLGFTLVPAITILFLAAAIAALRAAKASSHP